MNVNVDVKINKQSITKKLTNQQLGLFIANEWKRLINPYTPHRTGALENTAIIKPFEIEYIQPYSQYIYYGELYIDPALLVGGITPDGGTTFFSRKGVGKMPSGEQISYRKDSNPFASAKWDLVAEQNGQKEKLIKSINNYLLLK